MHFMRACVNMCVSVRKGPRTRDDKVQISATILRMFLVLDIFLCVRLPQIGYLKIRNIVLNLDGLYRPIWNKIKY